MKSTGVVRRIDELGRIVIPKEIRRNLGIRDGENVEIFTDSDSIILKKYYRLQESSELATNLCNIVNSLFNYKIIITDREKVIATTTNKDLLNKKITEDYMNIIEGREIVERENYKFILDDIELNGNFLYVPIISLNDSIGLIIIYNETKLTNELDIAKLLSGIISTKLDI